MTHDTWRCNLIELIDMIIWIAIGMMNINLSTSKIQLRDVTKAEAEVSS